METIIGILIIAAVGYVVWKMITKKETAAEAVTEVAQEAKAVDKDVADVNNDGKVDVKDSVAVVEKVKAEVKKRGPKKKAK
jgi:hypothetical protein